MTSSHHAPYVLGYTRTTMVGNRGKRSREAEQTPETRSQFGSQAATRLREVLRDIKTGGAWLSSARVVRCWVKSRNERNPYC